MQGYDKHYLKPLKERNIVTFEHFSKPQLLFKDNIDNSESPFIPKIKVKDNGITNINPAILEAQASGTAPENIHFKHPYEKELELFQYNSWKLRKTLAKQIPDIGLASTSFSYIENTEQFEVMMKKLEICDIISFDVHNHSTRSF